MSSSTSLERISTGVPEIDQIIGGGVPQGFLVAVTGEPGTGKRSSPFILSLKALKTGTSASMSQPRSRVSLSSSSQLSLALTSRRL